MTEISRHEAIEIALGHTGQGEPLFDYIYEAISKMQISDDMGQDEIADKVGDVTWNAIEKLIGEEESFRSKTIEKELLGKLKALANVELGLSQPNLPTH